LQAGFPAGVRVQIPFAGSTQRYTAAELFAGTEWTVLVGMVGVREVFAIPLQDSRTVFLVGPGLHGMIFEATHGHSSGGGGLVDTTLSWAFDGQRHGSWEFGFNLGLAIVGTEDTVFPLPTFGLFGGYHF
jgi:hypothetical protein